MGLLDLPDPGTGATAAPMAAPAAPDTGAAAPMPPAGPSGGTGLLDLPDPQQRQGTVNQEDQTPTDWPGIGRAALANLGPSAARNAAAIVQPFFHPIATAEALAGTGAGALQKTGVLPGDEFEPYADAVKDFFVKRYGSVDALKHTLATDPVGVAADLSVAFSGGETALARLPGVVGRVGEISGDVSRAVNPLNIAAKTVSLPAKATGLLGAGEGQSELSQAGVLMTPGQRLGGKFKDLEDAATSIPILGSFIKSGRANSLDSFNQAVGRQALEPIGESLSGVRAGHGLIDEVGTKLGNAYDSLLPNLQFTPDRQFSIDLNRVKNGIVARLPDQEAKQFDSVINGALAKRIGRTPMDGQSFKDAESELTHFANNYRGSPNPQQRDLAYAIDGVTKAMRSGLERSNPAQAQQLANINSGYAMFSRMRSAATRRVTSGGVFTPNDLLNAIKTGDKSAGKGSFARGDALMQTFAEAGQRVLPSSLPTSGTVERGATMAGLGGLSYLAGRPEILGAGALAALPYTRFGMRAANAAPYGAVGRGALQAGRLEGATPRIDFPALQGPAIGSANDQQDVNGPPSQQKNGGRVRQKNGFAHGGVIKPESGGIDNSFSPESIGAKRAKNGRWYLADPRRPGKWLMVRLRKNMGHSRPH